MKVFNDFWIVEACKKQFGGLEQCGWVASMGAIYSSVTELEFPFDCTKALHKSLGKFCGNSIKQKSLKFLHNNYRFEKFPFISAGTLVLSLLWDSLPFSKCF